jgi:hypothetical protein
MNALVDLQGERRDNPPAPADFAGRHGRRRWVRVGRLQRVPVLAATLAAVLAAAAFAACAEKHRPVQPDVDLHHPSGARRLEAVGAAAGSRDARYVPVLFDRLNDDDEAVRLMAAATLREMVGRDPGYQAFAPEAERLGMAAAWRAAWAGAGGGPPQPSPSLGAVGAPKGADVPRR